MGGQKYNLINSAHNTPYETASIKQILYTKKKQMQFSLIQKKNTYFNMSSNENEIKYNFKLVVAGVFYGP